MKKTLITLFLLFLTPTVICFGQENEYFDALAAMETASRNTLQAWTDALNTRNEKELKELYGQVVNYYQSFYTNEQVKNSHARFFKKNAYYHQYCDNVEIVFCNGCQTQLTFDKHVQTKIDGPYTTYKSYLHFIGSMDLDDTFKTVIIGESDATTDANLAKRVHKTLEVDNDTPLDAIFCNANVDKELDASYWDLVEMGAKEDGPLANLILTCGFPRGSINGLIKKDFNGQKGTFYCGGWAAGGECQWPVIFVYNPTTHKTWCIGGEEE